MSDLTRALLDRLRLSIVLVTADGEILFRNRAFDETFGSEADKWITAAARAVAGERGWLQTFFLSHEDGTTAEVDFDGRTYRVEQILTESTERPAVALAFHDVTEERQQEQAKSDFTSMVVHDLRGPLSGIQGTMEFILADRGKMEPVQLEVLEEALQETGRMMNLINEILDFSKIQSGNFQVENEPVRLSAVIKRAAKSLQSVASRSEIHLFSAVSNDLPQIHGSAEKLAQAIINLISNSLKFTPSHGVISVTGQTERRGGKPEAILISVTDSGVGIRSSELEQIFAKYKQAGSKSFRGGGGTGLGLYIVKQVVEAHGGTVDVASVHGVGTSMVLRFPLKRPAA
jgi:PAS domain S-box-containing protein